VGDAQPHRRKDRQGARRLAQAWQLGAVRRCAGSIWALIGSRTGARIARFSSTGRPLRVWRIADAGRMAEDREGCWISTDRWLLHIDPEGRVHQVVRARLGDVASGDGAVWLPGAASVLRIDERSG